MTDTYPKYKIMTVEEYAPGNGGCLWGEGRLRGRARR